jgi:hypothetical protein
MAEELLECGKSEAFLDWKTFGRLPGGGERARRRYVAVAE